MFSGVLDTTLSWPQTCTHAQLLENLFKTLGKKYQNFSTNIFQKLKSIVSAYVF